jgi:hypothetical protein
MISGTAVMGAVLVVADWMTSPTVRATEMRTPGQGGDAQIAPSTEIKDEHTDKPFPGLLDNVVVSELTKHVDHPTSMPDPRSELIMADRRPPWGPWKNVINHCACAEGYDSY